jgi:cell division protein FtsW (lipid II flippase)
MMTRQRFFLYIPLTIVVGLLIYCWTIIISTDVLATWRHYVGLGLFLFLMFFFIQSFKLAAIGTGFYLLLATFNVLSITAETSTSWLRIGPIETPPIQLLSLGIFILFAILNFDSLIDSYLDYKESKQSKLKR